MINQIIKLYWYIDSKTLVTILQVMKNLEEDLKRKIVSIIALRNKREEERQELIYNSYSFHPYDGYISNDQYDEYFSE